MTRRTLYFIINLILTVIATMTMCTTGHNVDTWQWWVVCLCVCFNFSVGQLHQSEG